MRAVGVGQGREREVAGRSFGRHTLRVLGRRRNKRVPDSARRGDKRENANGRVRGVELNYYGRLRIYRVTLTDAAGFRSFLYARVSFPVRIAKDTRTVSVSQTHNNNNNNNNNVCACSSSYPFATRRRFRTHYARAHIYFAPFAGAIRR